MTKYLEQEKVDLVLKRLKRSEIYLNQVMGLLYRKKCVTFQNPYSLTMLIRKGKFKSDWVEILAKHMAQSDKALGDELRRITQT